MLYECNQPTVPLRKEIAYIKDYIELFSLKSSKSYPIETYFNISNADVAVPPMLLIPCVENALKHSNIEKITGSFIRIYIDIHADELQFKVENSIPQKTTHEDNVGGIGLENVKRRLAILYPEHHRLTIAQNGATFKIDLNLTLNAKNKMHRDRR